MQHVLAYGLPTPPASPAFDQRCPIQHGPVHAQPCLSRYVSISPEQRLGRFLTGSLQLVGILGTGAYGVVYSALDVKTNVQYAVKCLSKFNSDGTLLDRRQVAFQTREIRLHYLAGTHPNVVSMLKIIDNPDCIYVILDYCPEGDLFYNITERGQYVGQDDLAKRVFLQILDAVEHCHKLGIYHRDLKPENILVSDHGATVKLADFGLATSSEISEDYGCGSTFYMSPECLDHTSTSPFYYCAPNDIWSLGVILVNLTCGRNPWKQASYEDSTYRAFTRNSGFLRTILPLTEDLNDILNRIFTRNPDQRITLPELRARILACTRFTQPQPTTLPLYTAPASQEYIPNYADIEESVIDDSFDYDNPLSPSSIESLSDSESTCSSDDGSVTSICAMIDDCDEDDGALIDEPPEIRTPPPLPEASTSILELDLDSALYRQKFVPQYAVPSTVHPMYMPVPQSCGSKLNLPFWGQISNKYTTLGFLPQPAAFNFHNHVSLFSPIPGY